MFSKITALLLILGFASMTFAGSATITTDTEVGLLEQERVRAVDAAKKANQADCLMICQIFAKDRASAMLGAVHLQEDITPIAGIPLLNAKETCGISYSDSASQRLVRQAEEEFQLVQKDGSHEACAAYTKDMEASRTYVLEALRLLTEDVYTVANLKFPACE